MSREIDYHAGQIAQALDTNCGQEATDALRQAIYRWPERATIDLVNAVNSMEQNNVGADLIVTPQVRNYYDQYSGQVYQDRQYLLSVLSPVNNRRQFDPQIPNDGRMYPMDEYGDQMQYQGQVDQWGRPIPGDIPQYDRNGRLIQQPQFDRWGNPLPNGGQWQRSRTYLQEDIGIINSDGSITPLRSQPRYVQR